jgi:hypothetical protein
MEGVLCMASFDARVKADLSESELTTLIRADGRLSTVRIILIGLPGDDDAAWLDKADGCVSKTFEPRDITGKVQDVLSAVSLLASE